MLESASIENNNTKERLHSNLVSALIPSIREIFAEGKYSDTVVKNLLKSNPKWGSKDRKFLAETIYEVVRWWRKLWAICGEDASLEDVKLWKLLGIYFTTAGYELPNWHQFEEISKIDISDNLIVIQQNRCLRESIPDWLDEIGEAELGEKWEKELHELNKPAPVTIRVNTIKQSILFVKNMLREEGIESEIVPAHPDALQLQVRSNIFRSKAFQNGWFEVQDASSQQVAYFMNVKPGMRVIDACAGGGGKTLHIAALMQNKGKIIALDIHEWKLKELQKRAARAGISIIEARHITSAKTIKRLEKSADRLLLDVPCSGLGVLRRNPDIKWKLTPESLSRITQQQHNILSSYSAMLKPAGKMVYATCSILPSENEHVVAKFLSDNKEFKKNGERNLLPSEFGHDGFYIASLERTG